MKNEDFNYLNDYFNKNINMQFNNLKESMSQENLNILGDGFLVSDDFIDFEDSIRTVLNITSLHFSKYLYKQGKEKGELLLNFDFFVQEILVTFKITYEQYIEIKGYLKRAVHFFIDHDELLFIHSCKLSIDDNKIYVEPIFSYFDKQRAYLKRVQNDSSIIEETNF